MAKRFLTGLQLTNLTSDPVSGVEGELYYNTVEQEIKIYSNSSWISLSDLVSGPEIIYSFEQPDVTSLVTGTLWIKQPGVSELDGGFSSSTYLTTYDGGNSLTSVFEFTADGGDS
jgi:hypothetical protein